MPCGTRRRGIGRRHLAFAYPVPTHVLADVFGIADDDIERFKQWTSEIFGLIGAGVADERAVEAGYRGVVELHDYVLALLDEKRRVPANDLLSALALPAEQESCRHKRGRPRGPLHEHDRGWP